MPLRRLLLLIIAVLAVFASACGSDDDASDGSNGAESQVVEDPDSVATDSPAETEPADTPTPDPDAELIMPEVTGELGSKPTITVDEASGRPDGLVIDDIAVGDGPAAEPGSTVRVDYVGVLAADGSAFDASWDRDTPFEFLLGAGQVIPGWDEGVEGMRVGGRRTLVIPAEMAYGNAGSGSGSIGPDADLVFVVDLLRVLPPVDPADEPDVVLPDEAPTELVIEDLVEGDGDEVTEGTPVTLHYVGVALSTGEAFDSSYESGRPVSFTAGAGQIIPGFDEGVLGMRVGGKRQIIIPPDLAYGAEGAAGVIGPDETLVFVVEAVAVG